MLLLIISETFLYDKETRVLLDRGYVIALSDIRGDAGHEDATGKRKTKSIVDLLAVANWLKKVLCSISLSYIFRTIIHPQKN
jgi:prolyl oligopeptidase PreP (S9A serine peptidase family)